MKIEIARLCLQFLDCAAQSAPHEGEGKGGDVLDFGCGTGLLAIAAVTLGARQALGVEIDHQSVQTARKNVALNRLDHKIDIRKGSWNEVHGKFDLVLANLVPSVLLRTGQNIPNHLKNGGRAVIAGFGRNQMNDMERFFMDAGLLTQKRMTLDENIEMLLLVRLVRSIERKVLSKCSPGPKSNARDV